VNVNSHVPCGQGKAEGFIFIYVIPAKCGILERQEGISCRVEESRIVFTAGETTAVFELLESAQILTNRTEQAEVIVTIAQNGGLRIKGRL
jgi:hypothetical protein